MYRQVVGVAKRLRASVTVGIRFVSMIVLRQRAERLAVVFEFLGKPISTKTVFANNHRKQDEHEQRYYFS